MASKYGKLTHATRHAKRSRRAGWSALRSSGGRGAELVTRTQLAASRFSGHKLPSVRDTHHSPKGRAMLARAIKKHRAQGGTLKHYA